MTLTQDEIREIALLARVGVTDDEVTSYQKELSSVLAYFETLQEIDTEDVEEIGHITGMTDVYRGDVVEEMSEQGKAKIMDNVIEEHEGYIKVKSVL